MMLQESINEVSDSHRVFKGHSFCHGLKKSHLTGRKETKERVLIKTYSALVASSCKKEKKIVG